MFEDEDTPIEKYIFGYPAGKSRMKKGLVKMITPHEVYVEAFCGSAAVFFHKEASNKEVLNDMNEDVIEAFKAVQSLTDPEMKALRKKDMKGSRELFMRLLKSSPTDKLGRLHKFLYLAAHSYGLMRTSWNPGNDGKVTGIIDRADKARGRLKGVKFRKLSYEKVVKEFDGKDTFFFFDPPYAGYDVAIGEKTFDEPQFIETLKSIKGRFIVTYGVKGKADFSKFNVQRIDQYRSMSTMRGVNRDKVLGTLVVTNYKGAVYKAFSGLPFTIEKPTLKVESTTSVAKSDSGSHSHVLDRKGKETALDGIHSHQFRVEKKDGAVRARYLWSFRDGPHQHAIPKLGSDASAKDGKHKHKVRVFDCYDFDDYVGEVIETDESGEHSHELLVSSTTYGGGLHKHKLKLKDGTVLTSLTAGEVAEQSMKKSAYESVPDDGSARRGALKVRTAEGQTFTDIWLDTGTRAVGWNVDLAGGDADRAESIAKSFCVDGNRDIKPITNEVTATELGDLDLGVLDLDGEVEDGKVLHAEAFKFEHGLQTEHSHEYFLKGDEMCGVLRIRATEAGWSARMTKTDLVPDVLSPWAIARGAMPPHGVSGLPSSVEKMVPTELRYWVETGERALELRKHLAASKMITPDSTALVNHEVQLVRKAVVGLYEPETVELSEDWIVEKVGDLYGGEVTERFTAGEIKKSKPATLSLYNAGSVPELVEALAMLEKLDGEYAVTCEDSPEAQETLRKSGRPFRMVPDAPAHAPEVSNRIFLTSFAVRTNKVEWLDAPVQKKAPPTAVEKAGLSVTETLAGLGLDDATVDQIRLAAGTDEEKEAIRKAAIDRLAERFPMLKGEIRIHKADEERFVYGVVLEPEVRDSQKDIYSEEEVRKAAHNFMQEYRNLGLMHQSLVNKKVKILESFLAPDGFKVGKESVKKGTWMMGVRVLDDALWKDVKAEKLTGFSIGGSAIKTPEK